MAGSIAPKVSSDSLIFYLDAANTKSKKTGDIYWNDLGGNQYGFTLSCDIGYSSIPTFNGWYITNGGSASYCISQSAFPLPDQVTYNFWVRMNNGDAYLLSDAGQSSAGHVFITKSNQQIGIGHSKIGTYGSTYINGFFTGPNGDTNFYANEWINIACTVNYSNLDFYAYRNGTLFGTASLTASNTVGPVPAPRSLKKYIGNYGTNSSGHVNDTSIVQIYGRILSADEIRRNYETMLPRHSNAEGITTNGLKLYLDMGNRTSYSGIGLAAGGQIWTDISPSRYAFSLTGSINFTALSKGRIRFLGTGSYAVSATAFPMYSQTSYSFWADCGTSSENLTFLSDAGQSAVQGFVWVYRKSLSDDLILEYSDGSAICGLTASNFFTGYAANRPSSAKWVNITAAVDYSGASASIYRDRNLYATFSMSGTPQVPISLVKYIGSYSTASVIPTGDTHRMATVAIHNRLLTAEEVNLNYQALRLRYLP